MSDSEKLRQEIIKALEKNEVKCRSYIIQNPKAPNIEEMYDCFLMLRDRRIELQNRRLKDIIEKLSELEDDIKQGIKELNDAINGVDNTVKTLEAANKLLGVVVSVLTKFVAPTVM